MRATRWAAVILCSLVAARPHERATAGEHEFRYKATDAQSVAVMGEFNSWKSVPMTKGNDGTWRAKVSLPSGTHGYKFFVNGSDWVLDPENANRKKVDGIDNSAVDGTDATSPPTATPAPSVSVGSTAAATLPAPALTRATPSAAPQCAGQQQFSVAISRAG